MGVWAYDMQLCLVSIELEFVIGHPVLSVLDALLSCATSWCDLDTVTLNVKPKDYFILLYYHLKDARQVYTTEGLKSFFIENV